MERSMRLVSAVFVLTLLLVATETMGPLGVEARSKVPVKRARSTNACESPSGKGMCFITNNCVETCKSEGFTGGQCRGFLRQCICSKKC